MRVLITSLPKDSERRDSSQQLGMTHGVRCALAQCYLVRRAGDRRRLGAIAVREETRDQIDGQREDDRGVLLGADLGQRLQVAELDT